MIKNNIAKILEEKEVSIKKLSENIEMEYSPAHALVKRESLDSTKLETLIKVAEYLKVDIEELYK